MKIAWFTPFKKPHAIGQCGAIVVAALAKQAQVTVFASDLQSAGDAWLPNVDLRFIPTENRVSLLASLHGYDALIYNFGDHYLNHGSIYEIAMQRPGITVIHDLVMNHFFAGYYFEARKDPHGYMRELAFAHGEAGRALGERVVAGTAGNIWEDKTMLTFHMAKSALRGTYGVITHSEFARSVIAEFASTPVQKINFPRPHLADLARTPPVSRLPPTPGKVRLLTYGVINSNKCVAQVMEAIGRSALLRERVVYHVIGTVADSYAPQLQTAMRRYALNGVVDLLGFQSDNTLHDYMTASDIVVNVRNPHFGESSWSLLESAVLGKPTVVWKHGYYDEYPDDTVIKVASMPELQGRLEQLVADADERRRIGARAQQYAQQTFTTEQYVSQLLAFIDQVRRARPPLDLADFMTQRLLEMGTGVLQTELPNRITYEIARLVE